LSDVRNHIIRKSVVELELVDEKSAFEIQQKVSHIFKNLLLNRLDLLFNKYANNGTTIQIDKIELNLGKLNADKLEKELVEKLLSGIEKEIEKKINYTSLSYEKDPVTLTSFAVVQNDLYNKDDSKTSKEIDIKIIDTKEKLIDLFFHFIQFGLYPWWGSFGKEFNLEKELLGNKIFDDGQVLEELRLLILKSTIISKRLVSQFSFNFNKELLFRFYPSTITAIEALAGIAKVTAEIKKNTPTEVEVRKSFYYNLFNALKYFNNKEPGAGEILEVLLESLKTTGLHISDVFFLNQLIKEISKVSASSVLDKETILFFSKLSTEVKTLIDKKKFEKFEKFENPSVSHDKIKLHVKKDNKQEEKNIIKDLFEEKYSKESFFIENAGLVLIAPFFQAFYKSLNLLENTFFKDEEALHRALLLSQYLVTGQLEISEHVLPLNKVIHGVDIFQPITKELVLSEPEIEACNDLLSSVIKHWKILKNTSPAGLRANFLQREGILYKNETDWKLKIERKTIDIVLNSIPWNYSIIKFSWMNSLLFVEW
jgi:hypothetical protein